MPRYASLGKDDATVVNIVEATAEYAATQEHWIPATDDCVLLSKWDGQRFIPPAPFVPDPVQTQAMASDAIQKLLDDTACAHGYDNIMSACSYAGSGVARWAAEGQACMAWRDACWSKALEIQTAVEAGTYPLPSVASVLAQMPAISWPT